MRGLFAARVMVSVLIALCQTAFVMDAKAQPLIVSYGKHNAEPYALVRDGKLVGGLIKDLMDTVGKEFGIEVQYKEVQRKHVDEYLREGKVHIIVLSNPKWLHSSELLYWSEPLIPETNIFVTLKESPIDIHEYEDLRGKKLGTILGYRYPSLEGYFASKTILRNDARSLEQNFMTLMAGRIDALVDSNILINHIIKANRLKNVVVISKKLVSSHWLSSALSPRAPITIQQLNLAYRSIRQHGELDAIMASYQ